MSPACRCGLDLAKPLSCLFEMCVDAETDPGRGISFGLIATSLNLLQHAVVLLGMGGQVLLDRSELRREQSIECEDERLHDSRDPPIAVSKRVNRDEMEMRHRSAYDDVLLRIARAQPLDHLAHQRNDLVGVGGLVRERPVRSGHSDRPRAPMPRALIPLEVARVEVEVEGMAVLAHSKVGSSAITPTWSIARA